MRNRKSAAPSEGVPPISISVSKGDADAVRRHLAHGSDPDSPDREGRTPLMYAVLDNQEQMIPVLAEGKCNVDAQNRNGFTALHLAAQDWKIGCVTRLLTAGATVDVQDVSGNTPLARAVFSSRGRRDIIQLLLQNGADRNKKNKAGISPLALAERIANYDLVKFFR